MKMAKGVMEERSLSLNFRELLGVTSDDVSGEGCGGDAEGVS